MPSDLREEDCTNCVFFLPTRNVTVPEGLCRRFPPKIDMTEYGNSVGNYYPRAFEGDWCGEWRDARTRKASRAFGV